MVKEKSATARLIAGSLADDEGRGKGAEIGTSVYKGRYSTRYQS
jgi:hypothetical protein